MKSFWIEVSSQNGRIDGLYQKDANRKLGKATK